jgi:hypothetical protein
MQPKPLPQTRRREIVSVPEAASWERSVCAYAGKGTECLGDRTTQPCPAPLLACCLRRLTPELSRPAKWPAMGASVAPSAQSRHEAGSA